MRTKRLIIALVGLGVLGVACTGGILLLTRPAASALAAPGAAGFAVVAQPSMTGAQIDHVLCQAASPACGTGGALYSLGVKYGIDPAFALAFFEKESTFGKFGIAAVNKGLGNIRCTPGYSCLNGFRAYQTWVQGYEDWYQLIRNLYVNTWHLMTVPQIVARYAPSSENNSALYASQVQQYVTAWRGAGPPPPSTPPQQQPQQHPQHPQQQHGAHGQRGPHVSHGSHSSHSSPSSHAH